jgi:signal transduction histidine kinase/ligand-binding sensor domain-containing protein
MGRLRLSFVGVLTMGLALQVSKAAPSANISASPFLATTWRTEEGLPHSSINSIVQSHDGYLWLGTFVGIVRFDGVRFVHFSTANMPELGPGRVAKLFEDRDGVLWIALETGRLVAWKNGEARIHLQNSTNANDAIVSMAQDRQGIIWIQTSTGRFGHLTSDGAKFLTQAGLPISRSNLGLIIDASGTLWVGTKDGLRVLENGKLNLPPANGDWTTQPVDAFASSRDGGLWLFRDRRLKKVQTDRTLLDIEAPARLLVGVVDIVEGRDGRTWLAASDGGMFCWESSTGWSDLTTDLGLHGPNKVLCEDREGNIWRGSFGGGLTRLRPRIFTVYGLPLDQVDRYALGVTCDAVGNVWALFNSRMLGRINPETKTLDFWEHSGFRTLYHDRRGALWLGYGDGRLSQWREGRFEEISKVCPQADFVSAFFEDAQSNLWVGFTQCAGVGWMPGGDPKNWRDIGGLTHPDVRCIAQTSDGAMWFGTHYAGVFRLQNERWTRFTTRDGLPSDYVRFLHAETNGSLWLGTIDGLCRYRDGKFTPIKTENGLWHNELSAIAGDRKGNFWISSFGGVFRVARSELNAFADGQQPAIQCIGYTRDDGLQAQESPGGFQPACTKTPDGRLWFPTVDGIVSVDPDHIIENKAAPPIVLEEILAEGSPVNAHNGLQNPIVISAGKHRVEFRFTALSFTAPEKVRFRHKLEGLDHDWSLPDDRRAVTYNFMPPGDYTFRVTACNNDGLWNPEGASIALVMRPFIWQTWWFRTSAAIAFAGALVFLVRASERNRARQRMEKLEQQHALERERARIAKDIHDEVGASLTQIAFLSQRVDGAHQEPLEVERWNQRIGTTVRRTIQSLDEIVWAVSPKHDTLESLANYLSRFAQDHLELAGIRCVLDVLTVLPPLALNAEVRHNLLLAAREALQNAVSHAAATEVRVALELNNDALEIRILDNGRGFDPQRSADEGNGLSNMRKRLEEIGGKLEITSVLGKGTTVKFNMPRGRLRVHGIEGVAADVRRL